MCIYLNGGLTPDDCDRTEISTWTDFNDWSKCSVKYGEGYRFRKRECKNCIGKDIEIQSYNITTYPIYGLWLSRTPYSTVCDIGIKQCNHSCIPPGSNYGNYTLKQRACGGAHYQSVVGIKETLHDQYAMKGYLAIQEDNILCVP
ncbi:unnamed protein product [Rotaria sordida]|uniref:Uncharacterized protein n=1 Tax=Rotaria sordida TaxID=392033 RepID=A0A818SET6_9BILA|nr:unnamed protein product [Rotaria sordida]CAF3667979.1 unnamed protein product [Rotaria sordida]